jgi:hypothetical protein
MFLSEQGRSGTRPDSLEGEIHRPWLAANEADGAATASQLSMQFIKMSIAFRRVSGIVLVVEHIDFW